MKNRLRRVGRRLPSLSSTTMCGPFHGKTRQQHDAARRLVTRTLRRRTLVARLSGLRAALRHLLARRRRHRRPAHLTRRVGQRSTACPSTHGEHRCTPTSSLPRAAPPHADRSFSSCKKTVYAYVHANLPPLRLFVSSEPRQVSLATHTA